LNILHSVEPIIENAVNTLQKVLDLKGSPLEMKMPVAAPPKPAEPELSLDSLAEAAAAPEPAAPAGLDLGAL
jgi:hypothetical protein